MQRQKAAFISTCYIILLCPVILGLAGCNPADREGGVMLATPAPLGAAFQTYLHPTGVFSVRLPPDWAVADLSTGDNLLVEFSPPGAARPSLTVRVRNTGAPLSIEAFEQAIGEYQAGYYGDPTIYTLQARAVQADGSWLVPALRRAGDRTLQINIFYQRNGAFFSVLEALLPDADPDRLETLDLIVDTYAVNPGAVLVPGAPATPPPAAPPGQSATGVVGFQGLYEWTDSQGTFHINGQVVNNDSAALEFVRIAAYLFGADGTVLAEQTDFAAADVVAPGEASPFRILFAQGKPPAAVRYELHASARYTEPEGQTFYGASNFTLVDRADFNAQGHLVIGGTVANAGGSVAHYVKVTVTVFDGQGRVVATDSLFVRNRDFAPGDSADYQLTFFELGGEAVRFTSTVQASLNWP
ncbi:MAG: hypothetical protein JXB47_02060 [Anaerolineae bacterium]|nr:hypothetical protein [Anaerolineae bacterium]